VREEVMNDGSRKNRVDVNMYSLFNLRIASLRNFQDVPGRK